MKTIAMFIFRDKFTDGFISFFEKYFFEEYNFTFFTNKNDNYKLSEHVTTIIEVEKFMDIFLEQKYEIVNQCDAFIISGFFVHIKHGYRFDAKLLDKIWIQFWGGDYTCFELNNFWHNPRGYLIQLRRLRVIRRCAGWISLITEEDRKISKCTWTKKKSYVAPVESSQLCEIQSLKITKERVDGEDIVVLLGNSASPGNYHAQIIKRLSHLANENIKIICPLSYGASEKYADKISKIGKKYFGDKFIPLRKFMPKDEYYELLHSVDVAIFNSTCQHALGNIGEMLRQGKKVYLRTTTPMWNWFLSRGQKIYDIKTLKNISADQLVSFPAEYARQNIEADLQLRQNKDSIIAWENVLKAITCNGKMN